MLIETLAGPLLSSLGFSAAAAWITKALITNHFERRTAELKNQLEIIADGKRAEVEGRIRQQVETALGDISSERQYTFEARKRLYTAIGPYKFQLLIACRDLSGRIKSQGLSQFYSMDVNRYVGRTTLYRILRPICIVELIERQIAYADFAVDSSAVELLKFKRNTYAIFSGDRLVKDHSKVDWSKQAEHIFFDQISRCANLLILREDIGTERTMRYHEFEQLILDPKRVGDFEPFVRILADMSPTSKPIFWLRLVAFANLCNAYINTAGTQIGFESRDFPVCELLEITQDSEICSNLVEYTERCNLSLSSAL